MAARLATEYKQIRFDLSYAQLQDFIKLFHANGFISKVKILESGDMIDTEVSFINHVESLSFIFSFKDDHYIYEGSCIVTDIRFAQLLQKAIRQYNGSALSQRIYSHHRVEYCYQNGKVKHIKELSNGKERLIYLQHDFHAELIGALNNQSIEKEIASIKKQIDLLLDQRRHAQSQTQIEQLDVQLKKYVHQLFFLEA